MSAVELLKSIEIVREKLNTLGSNKSLVDPEVIQLSQRLDLLLNIYYSMRDVA
ncbi:aspartyl-phosphate phosphatase Spo0E family protein [Desulfosporosinus sp. FKA]|uniref:aspartyl-phosphate phosphatase Spo0E family protein n=1 Tax=Desulfosporosinus sp. FKA TaxID=1969834 RepID=UPI000B49E2B7|nr:aspartyl-phosphate phosphatase Spo0E family protein [Desulfosporosinus sp. FKA]